MTRRLLPVAAGLVAVMAAATGWYLVAGGGSHKALPADGQSLPVERVWGAIIAAAQTAEPTTVPDGSIILVSQLGQGALITVDGSQWTMSDQNRDAWYDPRGMVFLMYREDGKTYDQADSKNVDPAQTGPVEHPDLLARSPQWIVSLPTDPGALADLLLAQSKDYAGDWSHPPRPVGGVGRAVPHVRLRDPGQCPHRDLPGNGPGEGPGPESDHSGRTTGLRRQPVRARRRAAAALRSGNRSLHRTPLTLPRQRPGRPGRPGDELVDLEQHLVARAGDTKQELSALPVPGQDTGTGSAKPGSQRSTTPR